MPEPAQLIAFVLASAILGVTPGPDIIYVVMRGAAQGPRAGLAAAAGLCTGIVGHTLLCVVGLSAALAASAIAFTAIKLAGAAYLVYLGIRMWRGGTRIDLSGDAEAVPLGAIYGYDVEVFVGLARFLQHRQCEEIRAELSKEHGITPALRHARGTCDGVRLTLVPEHQDLESFGAPLAYRSDHVGVRPG